MIGENNKATIFGEVSSGFNYSHETAGENFYMVDVRVKRLSGIFDIIPIMISERLINPNADLRGFFIEVKGQFRSFNKHVNDKHSLLLFLFANEVFSANEKDTNGYENRIYLLGYICKPVVYRTTPLGRNIADILVATNRQYNKSDYIPCICWGRNARFISQFPVGTKVEIEGRAQSREYLKKYEDGSTETKVAYEVSVSRIDIVGREDGEDESKD